MYNNSQGTNLSGIEISFKGVVGHLVEKETWKQIVKAMQGFEEVNGQMKTTSGELSLHPPLNTGLGSLFWAPIISWALSKHLSHFPIILCFLVLLPLKLIFLWEELVSG